MRNFKWQGLAAAIALSVTVTGTVAAGGGKGNGGNGAYIVQLADMPVTAYRGDIVGYKATAPRKGQKIDPFSGDVVSYKAYLEARHDRALASVGGGQEALQLRLCLQRLCRRTDGRAGGQTGDPARRAVGEQGRMPPARHRHDPGVPRPLRPGRLLGNLQEPRARTSSSASSTAAPGPNTRATRTAPA